MNFSEMFTIVEAGVLVLVLWEFLMGLKRGLSGELSRLIGTSVILIVALRFYQTLGRLMTENTRLAENQDMALAVAFLLIVISLAVLFVIIRLLLRLLMAVKFNDKIDRPAGGLVGLLRGALMAIICVYAVGLWPNEYLRDIVRNQSIVGRTVFRSAPPVIAKLRAIRWLDADVKLPALVPQAMPEAGEILSDIKKDK